MPQLSRTIWTELDGSGVSLNDKIFRTFRGGHMFDLAPESGRRWSVVVKEYLGQRVVREMLINPSDCGAGGFVTDSGGLHLTEGSLKTVGTLLVRGYLAGLKESGRGSRGKQTKLRRALARLLP